MLICKSRPADATFRTLDEAGITAAARDPASSFKIADLWAIRQLHGEKGFSEHFTGLQQSIEDFAADSLLPDSLDTKVASMAHVYKIYLMHKHLTG